MLPSQAKEDSQTQQASEGQCLFLWPPEEEGGWSADAARGTERRERGLRSPGPEPSCLPAASMAPQRKSDFSQVVLRALCTGACVSLVNACVAGECRPRGLRTQSRATRFPTFHTALVLSLPTPSIKNVISHFVFFVVQLLSCV